MSIPDARVADGVQDRKVEFKLVNLCFDALSNTSWAWLVVEGLGQLVHGTPHVAHLLVNVFSVQCLEWTCNIMHTLHTTP
jgi:hypothetical protein